jgi:flagellar hook assembly protein FlgD
MIQLKFKELIDLSKAHISVYNHLGQVVRTFSDVPKGKVQDLELHWDGNSDRGVEVPPGVYIFRLQTPGGQYSRKLVKLGR